MFEVTKLEFQKWTANSTFPMLPDSESFDLFRTMKLNPNFMEQGFQVELRGAVELNATTDKPLLEFEPASVEGRVPVYGGASFNLWDPDAKEPWAYVREIEHFRSGMAKKFARQSKSQKSAYFGGSKVLGKLPFDSARIAYRWITRATQPRTTIACLIPPGTPVVNSAPTIVVRQGGARGEAFVLGVMSSIPFDWLSKRFVELNFTFEVLADIPIPLGEFDSPLAKRCIEIAGQLAAVDERFVDWANEVGVPVASVKDEDQRVELIAELDAVVARLYGLSRSQLSLLYKTFHRGWDYGARLERVLVYFDQLEQND
jgi:hypothetical protein